MGNTKEENKEKQKKKSIIIKRVFVKKLRNDPYPVLISFSSVNGDAVLVSYSFEYFLSTPVIFPIRRS